MTSTGHLGICKLPNLSKVAIWAFVLGPHGNTNPSKKFIRKNIARFRNDTWNNALE
jgi:hypothetical protein